MKKRLISLVVVTAMITTMFAGCGKKNDDTLIVGTEAAFAPYEYMVGDKVVGVDMDIAQAIADNMGKKLVIKNMDFKGALLAVQKGTVDLVAAGVSVSPDREKTMDFSEKYAKSMEVIIVNKTTPAVKGASDDDLVGKIVGVQQGNIADTYVSGIETKEVKRYSKFAQAAQDLKNNKIDCIVMDKIPGQDLVAANPELSMLDGTLYEDEYAIAVKKGNKELLDKVNTVIAELKKNGKIDEFTDNHIGNK